VPPTRAVLAQANFADRVVLCPLPPPRLVAAVDISYSPQGEIGYAVAVIVQLPKLKIVEIQGAQGAMDFAYMPGLLAFREGPLTATVIKKLTRRPEVILFDGAGVAHPRRFGLASHLGVIFDVATVGCAKSSLLPDYAEPGPNRGDFSPLMSGAEVLGAALRTRAGVKPVFASAGHRVDLSGAIDLILATTTRYRFPEPLRHAHRLANKLRAENRHRS
jgi:deoxyribonuclease V